MDSRRSKWDTWHASAEVVVDDAAERLSLTPDSPWWAEHRSRYKLADALFGEGRYLDVACGSGLGFDLLQHGDREVVGVDRAWEAVSLAASSGSATCLADGTALPFADATFDGVCSFETLEHLQGREAFVRELHRVLRPGGRLVLSTPNARHTRPVNGVPRNPFHVHEYESSELRRLLEGCFAQVELLGQRTTAAYGACPYWESDPPLDPQRKGWRAGVWKVLRRLPNWMAEPASRLTLGRELYPGIDDFSFIAADVDVSHVIVAVCEK